MKIVSFGDSFLFGTDLADSACGLPDIWRPSLSTWPALLATHAQAEYLCCAYPGVGNFFTLREIIRILAEEKNKQDLFFCIGWTWIDRFDYQGTSDHFIWNTVRPTLDNQSVDDHYYRNLHSELTDKFHSLVWMHQAICLLEQAQVRYVMTMMDDLVFDTKFHAPSYVVDLQQRVRPHITYFDGSNFLDWSKQKNFAISAGSHPLEEAHQAAFDYLLLKTSN
jgi:hypothetical protein